MSEDDHIAALKAEQKYYTPEPTRSCVASLAFPSLFLIFACSFFALWLSGALTSGKQPLTPTPQPTPAPVVMLVYAPTPVPMLINAMTGYDQTVSFSKAKGEIGYSFINIHGKTEQAIVCRDANVCTWKALPVPTGQTLKIIYREPSPMWPFRLPLQYVLILPDTLDITLD
jgi:hypothetical protein